jgi:hypothetical protein
VNAYVGQHNDRIMQVDVAESTLQWRLNPFSAVDKESQGLAASNIVEVFKKLWPDDWGPRLMSLTFAAPIAFPLRMSNDGRVRGGH